MKLYKVVERIQGTGVFQEDNWRATVDIRGTKYKVGFVRGDRRVRIAYSARWGWHWFANVRQAETGTEVYSGQVSKSTGLVWILEHAGLIPWRDRERQRVVNGLAYNRKEAAHWQQRVDENKAAGVRTFGGVPSIADESVQRHAEQVKVLEANLKYDDELRKQFGLSEGVWP